MSFLLFKRLVEKIEKYNEDVNKFSNSLKETNDVYKNNRLSTGKFITDAGGESTGEVRPDNAIYQDSEFKRKDDATFSLFKKTTKYLLEQVYSAKNKEAATQNPLFNALLRGDSIDIIDIKKVFGTDKNFQKENPDLTRIAAVSLEPPLREKGGNSRKEYYDIYRPSVKNYKGDFSQYDASRKSYTRQMTTEKMKETEETEKMGKEDEDAKTQEEIDEEDAKKLAAEAEAAAAAELSKTKDDEKTPEQIATEAEINAAKNFLKAKAAAEAKAKAEAEEVQVEGALKAQQGGKVEIESEQVQPEQEAAKLTRLPRPEDNTVVVEQGRNDMTPDQAMKMSTLDISKEEKEVDDMPIKTVRKRIDALHVLYQDVIKVFQTDAHKKDREQSKKNDSKARNHLKMMLKAVREYYRESSSMQVGVIIPAHQLVASIMSKIGMQMPTGGMSGMSGMSGPPPPPPPPPPSQAESKDDEAQGKDEKKGDQDEDEEKEEEKPTASTASASTASASQKGGVGSVKEHAGDKLKKTGDRFGHGFHVSVNYRNSGMEAYQRRAVGRHVLKDDVDERQGMLADPQPQLNQPALARYIQKIPGFKG